MTHTVENDAGPWTVTEYAVRYEDGTVLEFPHPTLALSAAVSRIRHEGEGVVVTRRRTVYADALTDWTERVTPSGKP